MQDTENNGAFRTELREYASRREEEGPYADNLHVDVLIVGAGFSGVSMLKALREHGLKVAIYEAGTSLGGTWRWNCYPGARVDSEIIEYEFPWPEVYNYWNWTTSFPDYRELRAYFDHVDRVLDIKKDCAFETVVTGAQFQVGEGKWHVKTADGRLAKAKYLILAVGFSAKRYVPHWPGLERFKGIIHHSSFWPDEDVDVKNKRCAVIGTGATGLQIAENWANRAGSLKVFQRTPNLALPMHRRSLSIAEQENSKVYYRQLFRYREKTPYGFITDINDKNTFDDSPKERDAFYHSLWDKGGLRFWVANYKDIFFSPDANKEAYRFWQDNVRGRISDDRTRDILAPMEMPHYFGIKRPSLETAYYDIFNRDNVDIVDVKHNPITSLTETGIKLEDGTCHELDVIALATGFDIVSGSMTNMDLIGINGTPLADEWKDGVKTYLGMMVPGYPNMFHMYGVHGPTLFSNGPTTIEIQAQWISLCIKKMERDGLSYINPTASASADWKAGIEEASNSSLFPTTLSTYMGGNVPGKKIEQMNYACGVPQYAKVTREALDSWKGFEIVKT